VYIVPLASATGQLASADEQHPELSVFAVVVDVAMFPSPLAAVL
jgi:hypothetical protein